MKVNKQLLLAKCIEDGLQATLANADDLTIDQMSAIAVRAEHEIWIQIDSFFTFEED
jgi:hypothetical protein